MAISTRRGRITLVDLLARRQYGISWTVSLSVRRCLLPRRRDSAGVRSIETDVVAAGAAGA